MAFNIIVRLKVFSGNLTSPHYVITAVERQGDVETIAP